jgi:hypothetical protein
MIEETPWGRLQDAHRVAEQAAQYAEIGRMNGEHGPTEDKDRGTFEDTPCATIIQRMMGRQGEACSCLEMMGADGANGCRAEMIPQMKAACRRFAFYAGLALVALVGGTALLVWALFHFIGA